MPEQSLADVPESTPAATLEHQFGREVESFEAVRSTERIDFGSVPSYVPENLTLASVRSFGDGSVTMIYALPGVPTNDNQTVVEIYDRSAIMISYFSSMLSPDYNKTKASEQYVLHTPNSKLNVVNGNPESLAKDIPLIVTNTYDFQAKTVTSVVEKTKSQVTVYLDKGTVSVLSSSYSLEELAHVAESAISYTDIDV